MSDEQAAKGPDRFWHIGPYTFARYNDGRVNPWECSAHGRGVGGHSNPVSAFLALRRWLNKPIPPQPDDQSPTSPSHPTR